MTIISLPRSGCIVILALLLLAGSAQAVLTIEITEGVEGALPIAIVPFLWEGPGVAPREEVSAIVATDLKNSGRFAPLPERDLLAHPHEGAEVNFKNWRILGIDNLIVGKIRGTKAGGYVIKFWLFDVYKGTQLYGLSIEANSAEMRYVAHQISDILYEALTGEPGAFNTRIAYVSVIRGANGKNKHSLNVADADGANEVTVLESPHELLSPAWSPDGRKLAYVSFETNRSEIYVQELETQKRTRIASYPGHNGAPAWSPDGKRLALTLSKRRESDRSNFDIWVYDLVRKSWQRLTRHWAIDTYPSWAPDGKSIVFSSDRSGRMQVYRIPAKGGRAQRLTFEGSENDRPIFSPDGKSLGMVHTVNGKYRIAVMDLETGYIQVLTDGSLDETPSFAPNGNMIIYATNHNNKGVLFAVSVDGRVKNLISSSLGEVREPAWSPFMRK